MKHLSGIFIFLLLIITCSMRKEMTSDLSDTDLSPESKMLYGFINKTADQVGKKYGMLQCSVGGGVKDGSIWLMSFSYQRYNSYLNEEEARQLIVNVVEDYLKLVNQDKELRPFLQTYPFTSKNVSIGIISYGTDRREVVEPYVCAISADEGNISYLVYEKPKSMKFKSEKSESYEEAVAILQQEKDQSNKN